MKYDDILNSFITDNKKVKIHDHLYLSNYQISVLKKYQIPYETCKSVNEIIYYIEDILNEETNHLEDLEQVSLSLGEIDYYENYRK